MGFTFKFSQGLLVLLMTAASMAELGLANKGWDSHHQYPYNPRKVIVGGSKNWSFGVNYTDWSLKTAPFYFNDTLVFKYDPPSNTTFPHNVYLLPNLRSFQNCELKKAKLIANPTQGGGNGFEFVLKKKKKPYYFVCTERNGFHCKVGLMKFSVVPLPRGRY